MPRESATALKEKLVRRLRIAIALSLLVHVLLALIFLRPSQLERLRPPPEAPTETVTISKAVKLPKLHVVPTQHAALPPKPTFKPPARTTAAMHLPVAPAPPIARSRPIPHELAKIAPHAPLRLPKTVEAGPPSSAGSNVAAKPRLSGQQIAQIQADLGKSIARDREGIDPLHVPPGAPPEMKHYGADYAAFTTGERDHHGLCDPIKDWTEDGWDYYYVVCNVRFSDGSYERQSVPWPVRFDPKADPFVGTGHGDQPLAMPLPGWHLAEGETVSTELREYAKAHGVEL